MSYTWSESPATPVPGGLQWSGIPGRPERLSSKRPIVLTDLDDLPRRRRRKDPPHDNDVRSLLVVPVVAASTCWGLGFIAIRQA